MSGRISWICWLRSGGWADPPTLPRGHGEALERIVGEVVRRVAHQVGAERGEGVDLAGLGENVGETIPRLHAVEGQRRLDCDAVVNVGLGDTGCGAAF